MPRIRPAIQLAFIGAAALLITACATNYALTESQQKLARFSFKDAAERFGFNCFEARSVGNYYDEKCMRLYGRVANNPELSRAVEHARSLGKKLYANVYSYAGDNIVFVDVNAEDKEIIELLSSLTASRKYKKNFNAIDASKMTREDGVDCSDITPLECQALYERLLNNNELAAAVVNYKKSTGLKVYGGYGFQTRKTDTGKILGVYIDAYFSDKEIINFLSGKYPGCYIGYYYDKGGIHCRTFYERIEKNPELNAVFEYAKLNGVKMSLGSSFRIGTGWITIDSRATDKDIVNTMMPNPSWLK